MESKMQNIQKHPIYIWFTEIPSGETFVDLLKVYKEILSAEDNEDNVTFEFADKLKELFEKEVDFIENQTSHLTSDNSILFDKNKPNYQDRSILYTLLRHSLNGTTWYAIASKLIERLNETFTANTVYELKDRERYDDENGSGYFYVKSADDCDGNDVADCWIIDHEGNVHPSYQESPVVVEREEVNII
jgi:hypothetical protein